MDRLRWAIYGAVLILVMIFLPTGAAGLTERLRRFTPQGLAASLRSPLAALRAHPIMERLGGGGRAGEERDGPAGPGA